MKSDTHEIAQPLTPESSLEAGHVFIANPVQWADRLLRIAVIVHAAGLAISLFGRSGSGMGGVALMEWGITHDTIFLTERIAALVLLFAALSVLIYPTVFSLLLIGAAIAAEAYATSRFGGNPYDQYTLLSQALRFLVPVAIIFAALSYRVLHQEDKHVTMAAWILRIGLASVFLMHGLEALWHDPQFIDLIIGSANNAFGVAVGEGGASSALTVIGSVDIAAAALLLIRPWHGLLIWMCFWGLITALSRPVAMGIGSYTEVLIRASHFIAPIALWLIVSRKVPSRSPTGSPESSS